MTATTDTRIRQSIMVVGGHGFLGRKIVSALLGGFPGPVAVLDIADSATDLRTHFYQCDITDEAAVHNAIASFRPTCIIHTAAALSTHSADAHWRVNFTGTRHLLAAGVTYGVTAFVYTSDACVAFDGRPLEGVTEQSKIPAFASHSYNDSKASAESLVKEFRGRNGLRICILRPSYIFGPGISFIDVVMSMSSTSRKVSLEIGDNTNLADWVYVDNVAHAHLLAAQRLMLQADVDGETFFITNDEPRPFWDVPKTTWLRLGYLEASGCRITGISPTLATYLVGFGQMIGLTSREFCVLQQYYIACFSTSHWYDISKAKAVLGYKPHISLDDGIRRTVEWHMRYCEA